MSFLRDSKEELGGKKWIKTATGWKTIEHMGEFNLKQSDLEVTQVHRDFSEDFNTILESSFVKCIKRRQGTSRESSSYISIGQAMQQMHLIIACEDYRYQAFVLQVMGLLFHETVYPCLAGSAQIYIMTILDALINSVIRKDESCSAVLSSVNDIISSLRNVYNNTNGHHSKKRAQIHLKKLERTKSTILEHLEETYSMRSNPHIFTLPKDCLRHIIICIKNPVDMINFGMTCRETWSIVYTSRLWTDAMRSYSPHSQIMCTRPKLQLTTTEAIEVYRQWYRENQIKSTRIHQPLLLCSLCEFLYWKGSSHPCIVKPNRPRFQSNITATITPVSPQEFINMFL